MQQPTRLISTPFAQEGEKTEIQNVTGEFDNSATYRLGFPPITMQSIRLGGKPPKRTDFNGILFDITENISFLCKGGRYQYNAGLSTLMGGYPKGSNLLLDDNVTEVVSTVAGNQNNPNTNMTGWVLKPNRTTAEYVLDASGETQQQVNYNGGSKWHSRVGGYLKNERVVLANGDIVKSTIDENENDPNEDMTGWVKDNSASQIFDESGLSQQDVNDSALIKSPQLFGAKGSANNDQVAFTNLSADYAYALGAEYTVPVWRTQATKFIGNGTKVNLDSVNGDTTVCLQIKPNSNYSDIDFVNNPTAAKSWTYSTIGNNSVLTNVGFYNFDDSVTPKNSWGIYFENKENITLINPKFGGNGLSDITILDNVKNITIVNAVNTVNPDGVHLDIEPNGSGNIENINIIGGEYSQINVLENYFLSIGIKSLNIIGANVKLLELRGGQTKIIGGKVEKIKGNWANALDYEGMQNEYFCSLEVDGFNLSENLLEDEFMNSLSAWDTNSFFSLYAPDGASIIRKKDDNGYYLSINANKNKNYHVLNQRGFTSLPLGADVICIAMAYSVENTGSETMFQPCIVSFFNDSDVKVGDSYSLKGGRTAAGMNYDWSHEVSIFDIPSGATKFKITVRNNKTGSTLNVRKIGVHTLTKTDGAGNFNAVVASYGVPNLKNSYKQAVTPVDLSYGYNGLLVETPDAAYKYVGSGNTFTLQLVEKVKVFGSASVNASIPANTTHTETKTITGAKVGQTVSLSPNAVIGASVQLWGEVTAVDTVALYLRNTGATSASVVASLNIVLE